MTVLAAITGGNVGTAATAATATFSTHANGDLETILGAVDGDFGEVATNATNDYGDGYLLDAMPANFVSMTDLSVRLRYGWSATPTSSTWNSIQARIVVESDGTILAGLNSGGAYQTVASSIVVTTPTNSSVVAFTYVLAGNATQWNDATLQIVMNRTRSGGGGAEGQRVYAGEITGNYVGIGLSPSLLLYNRRRRRSRSGRR